MSKQKIVIYTAIFGPYDGLIPQKKIDGVDFICFTDQDFKSNSWKIIKAKREFDNDNRNAKKFKVLPHLYLNEYDVSMWIDGNFLVEKLPFELIQLLKVYPMVLFKHGRQCIYDEYQALMEMGTRQGKFKDSPDIMTRQIERYKQDGFPPNEGLAQNGVIIRNHHDPIVINTMNLWWEEIANGSQRDQLSLFYCRWKTQLSIFIHQADARANEWFYMIGQHRKNYFWKLVRYRLKVAFGIQKKYQL